MGFLDAIKGIAGAFAKKITPLVKLHKVGELVLILVN